MAVCLSFSRFLLLVVSMLLSGQVLLAAGIQMGINYGQIANNLPSPTQVAGLLQSLSVTRVKLYDSNPDILSAFANTNIEFIIGIANDDVANMGDPTNALVWLKQHVQPYLPQTKITCINVGNEVYSGNDKVLMSNLLPAMQSLHGALVTLGLDKQVNISTAHSFEILGSSYPPSAGSFREDLAEYIQPLLSFHSQINSPFLINVYPFFAYKESPDSVSLQYLLFEPNSGVTDPQTNLKYDNMLYAQIDSVYAAMKAMGHTDVGVRISETGWPSKGDPDEAGATPENAALYNRNLMQRIAMNQGTPLNPSVPIDVYVFALFNEDLKPGPTSERNYGLFYPDATPVYNTGLQGYLVSPSTSLSYTSSSSKLSAIFGFGLLMATVAGLI